MERAAEMPTLSGDSELAQMVVEWNQTCDENYALVGLEWVAPTLEAPKPWWRFWE